MDIVFSLIGLAVFMLPMLFAAAGVYMSIGRPVLFKQPRTGRYGQDFDLLKFRTMTNKRGASGELLPDDMRLTRFGRWLRSTSGDELPEFWNILRGDMSLVGPRPLLPEYMPYYTNEERHRFDVRPGLTGLAQVSGRNALDWDTRLQLDSKYVKQMSLRLDIWVLWKTAATVFSADGVSADGHATMPRLDKLRTRPTDASQVASEQTVGGEK